MGNEIINREIKQVEREILLEKYATAMKKNQFINELNNGLGEQMKINPGKAKIIKKTWTQRLSAWLKKIFTKF